MDVDVNVKKLTSIGLNEQKAKETLKNEAVTKNLLNIITEAEKHCKGDIPRTVGNLLYNCATRIKKQSVNFLPLLAEYIANSKIDNEARLNAALEYLLANPQETVSITEFETACGIGVVVTKEDIESAVNKVIESNKLQLENDRYRFNFGMLLGSLRKQLPWADGKTVKNELDTQVAKLLGPKTEADLAPPAKGGKNKVTKSKKKPEINENSDDTKDGAASMADLMQKIKFHAPGENFKTDGYVTTSNTHTLLKEHLKITGGQVRTRFPPEPNGILHIGHAKAININFGYAKAHGGTCNLRYDDTNPEKEEEKFFIGIRDMVEWLGYKPHKVTHSSDNFQQLYEWACQLIEDDLAYVCHQTADEMKGQNVDASPWRNRPIPESRQLFQDMKNGKIDEGAATLRLKLTLEEGKQDPVAYRIKFCEHHRTGDKWCIYPTYDYTHCLCDSIEHITHSLCTKEFQSRRSSYYWLCNALNIYCPVQWEYGRLNMNYTVVSKRKIAKLIDEGVVRGWDDPRLFTLTALRRRGFPPEAINNFCARLGVTGAQISIDPDMLDSVVRDVLNTTAKRAMAVMEPIKVVVTNLTNTMNVAVPDYPADPDRGSHVVPLNKVVYIDRCDFKESNAGGYRRLTPNQPVGLRHAGLVINVTKVITDRSEQVISLEVECQSTDAIKEKPKAFIQWVSDPVRCEVRCYERLFKHKNPEDPSEVPNGFISDVQSDSLKIIKAMVDKSVVKAPPFTAFQFERLGFFSVDPDTTDDLIIFNRTVSLREDAGK